MFSNNFRNICLGETKLSLLLRKFNRLIENTENQSSNIFTFQKLLAHNGPSTKEEKRKAEMMARGIPKKNPIPGVENIVLVASGKGGVGKSTTSVNLAVALSNLPLKPRVGLLDADVFGPSIPLLMGVNEEPLLTADNKMIPLVNFGVKCMSMGFLVTEKSAIIWRGLMVMSAIEKLIRQVEWGPLDYLIVDTPPGTGDTLLSLIQNLPISGVVIVSTPQTAALQVARRGASMLQKLSVPIIGIVQNMSTAHCPNCNKDFSLFGNGTKQLAEELGIQLLCDIGLDPEISRTSDCGKPFVISRSNNPQAQRYKRLAEQVDSFIRRLNETKVDERQEKP